MFKKLIGVLLLAALAGAALSSAANAAPSKKYFYGPCDFDPKISKEWAPLQNYMFGIYECLGPVKVLPAKLTSSKPRTKVTAVQNLELLEKCKIENSSNSNQTRAFPNSSQKEMARWRLHPGPNTTIQVVPIFTPDAQVQSGSTPQRDYGKYFKFLTDYYKYVSDGPSTFRIRVPENYIEFPKALTPYTITHHASQEQQEKQRALGKEIIAAVDSKIDFVGADMVLVVVPAETKFNVMEQGGLGFAEADGQQLRLMSFAQQYTLKDGIKRNRGFMAPMWWMHELYHIGTNLEDHNGSNYWQNMQSTDPAEAGMGNWGLMSMSKTELTTWEKWLIGLTLDSQVRCASTSNPSLHWIVPSSVKSTKSKLLVIPISSTKVVVIESIRAAGLNYMLPKESEGALVYTVDTSIADSEYGFKVISGSKKPISREPFILSDAPLKKGQSVSVEGVKITNVEWGEFGDVIKVEPVK